MIECISMNTNQMKKVHVFSKSVINGTVGAGIAMDHLCTLTSFKENHQLEKSGQFIKSVEDDKLYQKMGVDFLLYKEKGSPLKIEVKTELYVKPDKPDNQQNIFFEVISNDTKGVLGWTYSTKADIVIYYMPYMGLALFMPFPQTAEWLKENETKFSNRLRTSRNPRYSSHGYAINYKVYGHEMKKYLGQSIEYHKFPEYTELSWQSKIDKYISGEYKPQYE